MRANPVEVSVKRKLTVSTSEFMRCNLLEVQQTHTALPIVCSKACFQEL